MKLSIQQFTKKIEMEMKSFTQERSKLFDLFYNGLIIKGVL